ncbi:hypothetical protein GTW25_00500 [Aliihoeflea aestuarii]|jgi:hypothetical protein|uniref:hypothetical protein n=1 Tax=Aliihoeflea aestuarii TaxID=453840 RepID=UPI002092A554|nr:hypothetical protein [Aliihoeflea aestuarii]MCO6389509.1 hypothetical protein [Aliihoeflea aestuarii]
MKTAIHITMYDLIRSLRSTLHGMADDVATGYRRGGYRRERDREEADDDRRRT